MDERTKKLINHRFNELLIKDCQGTATPMDLHKLDRYQALRLSDLPPVPRQLMIRAWEDRKLLKHIKSIMR